MSEAAHNAARKVATSTNPDLLNRYTFVTSEWVGNNPDETRGFFKAFGEVSRDEATTNWGTVAFAIPENLQLPGYLAEACLLFERINDGLENFSYVYYGPIFGVEVVDDGTALQFEGPALANGTSELAYWALYIPEGLFPSISGQINMPCILELAVPTT
jgi:hypothetical protein